MDEADELEFFLDIADAACPKATSMSEAADSSMSSYLGEGAVASIFFASVLF